VFGASPSSQIRGGQVCTAEKGFNSDSFRHELGVYDRRSQKETKVERDGALGIATRRGTKLDFYQERGGKAGEEFGET